MGPVSSALTTIQNATGLNLGAATTLSSQALAKATPHEIAAIAISALEFSKSQDLFGGSSSSNQPLDLFASLSSPQKSSGLSQQSLAAMESTQQMQNMQTLYGLNSSTNGQSQLSLLG